MAAQGTAGKWTEQHVNNHLPRSRALLMLSCGCARCGVPEYDASLGCLCRKPVQTGSHHACRFPPRALLCCVHSHQPPLPHSATILQIPKMVTRRTVTKCDKTAAFNIARSPDTQTLLLAPCEPNGCTLLSKKMCVVLANNCLRRSHTDGCFSSAVDTTTTTTDGPPPAKHNLQKRVVPAPTLVVALSCLCTLLQC